MRSAESVVTIHERMADSARRLYRIQPARVRVIPNWTHVRPFEGDASQQRVHRGWEHETCLVVHAGNIGAKQGLEHVVAAGRAAAEGNHPARFVIIGEGSAREDVMRAASGLPNIEFLPPLASEDFMSTLAAADVLLLHESPGLKEMCAPSKLTTYFEAGRPVLAVTDPASAAADEVRASGAGIVVPAGDPGAFLSGLDELLSSDHASMAEAARCYAREHLSEGIAHDAYR